MILLYSSGTDPASSLARNNAFTERSKFDVFASYPVVQMMTAPNDPLQKTSPSMKIAVAGGVLGYFFITAVILIIWQREFLLKRLLNKQ